MLKHFDYPFLTAIIHKPSFLIMVLGHLHNWEKGSFNYVSIMFGTCVKRYYFHVH